MPYNMDGIPPSLFCSRWPKIQPVQKYPSGRLAPPVGDLSKGRQVACILRRNILRYIVLIAQITQVLPPLHTPQLSSAGTLLDLNISQFFSLTNEA